MGGGGGGRLSEVGTNSRLGTYLNKYGTLFSVYKHLEKIIVFNIGLSLLETN